MGLLLYSKITGGAILTPDGQVQPRNHISTSVPLITLGTGRFLGPWNTIHSRGKQMWYKDVPGKEKIDHVFGRDIGQVNFQVNEVCHRGYTSIRLIYYPIPEYSPKKWLSKGFNSFNLELNCYKGELRISDMRRRIETSISVDNNSVIISTNTIQIECRSEHILIGDLYGGIVDVSEYSRNFDLRLERDEHTSD